MSPIISTFSMCENEGEIREPIKLDYQYRELAEVPQINERGDTVWRSGEGGDIVTKHCGVVRFLAHVYNFIVTLKDLHRILIGNCRAHSRFKADKDAILIYYQNENSGKHRRTLCLSSMNLLSSYTSLRVGGKLQTRMLSVM